LEPYPAYDWDVVVPTHRMFTLRAMRPRMGYRKSHGHTVNNDVQKAANAGAADD